jgi:uncharacterized repeat protein (TIGR02543 family)
MNKTIALVLASLMSMAAFSGCPNPVDPGQDGSFAVSYDGNGADGGTVPDPQTKIAGIALTLAGNSGSLTRSGYTFTGWNTAADGSGTDYAAGASYTVDAAVTLYAQWTTLPTYTVSYDGNGADGGTVPDPQTKIAGIALTLAGNSGSLTRAGYTFTGWNTAADGSGTDYAAGASYTVDAAVTLYAQWTTLTTYSVSYDGNGADEGSVPVDPNSYSDGAEATILDQNDLARTGYNFAGWTTNPGRTGSSESFAVGTRVAVDSRDRELYAIWVPISLSVVSDENRIAVTSYGTGFDQPGNFELPAGITEIGDNAMDYMANVTAIDIPSSVVSIGDYAFYHSSGLEEVVIHSGVKTIGSYAFGINSNLPAITIPDSVEEIGSDCFMNSESLVSIAVDAANTHYMSNGGILYDKAGTTLIAAPGGISGDIVVPSPVEKIGRTAFWECENIESIEFPPTLREIEHAAFLGTKIASVVLPEGFTTLGSTVFQNSGLASISLPSTTQTIGLQAFQNCGLLTSVVVPANVTEIGRQAFNGCTDLLTVTLESDVPPALPADSLAFGLSPFNGDPSEDLQLIVPEGRGDSYRAATGWSAYASHIVEA